MAETLSKLSQLELGLYQDAKDNGLTLSEHLEELHLDAKISEDLVRSDLKNSKGETLSAFKQILLKAGIHTKGRLAQTGGAFFSEGSTNNILFPEFVATEYRDQTRELLAVFVQLADLVTTRIGIDGTTHKAGILMSDQDPELEFGRVPEGSELPKYTIKHGERAIDLFKYGGSLEFTYEVIRRMKLPMLSRYIGKVAKAQEKRKIKRAMVVALLGDGNMNPALDTLTRQATIQFRDAIDMLFEAAKTGADVNKIVGDAEMIGDFVALFALTADGRPTDRNVPFNTSGGELPSPLGMQLKLALPGSILDDSTKLLGADSSEGLLEIYENGSEITESDRLITKQFERLTFTENIGYAKIDPVAFRTKTLRP